MAVRFTHEKVIDRADGADTALAQPSDWNADHILEMSTQRLLGRYTAGDGTVQEIELGAGLSIVDGVLTLTIDLGEGVSLDDFAPLESPTFTGVVTIDGDLEVNGDITITSAAPKITMVDLDGVSPNKIIQADAGVLYVKNGVGTVIVTVTNAGAVTAVGDITTSSDERLKTDIEPIEGALEICANLTGVRFTRTDTGVRRMGLVAQASRPHIPEVVHENGDFLGMSLADLAGLFVQCVNGLSAKVTELTARLDKVERA